MVKTHRTRMLWLVGMLHVFTHLYQVALIPLYLRIQQDLKLSHIEQATLLVTVLGVAYFLPSYFLGALADKLNRKKLLTLGIGINAAAFVGLSFAPNYALALVCAALAGFGGSFYHPAATALVARTFPEAKGRALGLVGIGASVGFFLGPVYAGWRGVNAGSWRVPVFELGVLGLVACGLFAWLAEDERAEATADRTQSIEPRTQPLTLTVSPSHGEKGNATSTYVAGSTLRLFPTAALWLIFFGASFALSWRDFAGSAMATSGSLFLQNAQGLNPKSTGLILSGLYLASVISNPLFGSLSDAGRMRWVAFVLTISAALISVFPRVPVGWMAPVLLAYGFFFMASYPITEAAVMDSVPDAIRGRVFGLFITVSGLIANLSHWLVGGWVGRLGPRSSVPASYLPLYGFLSLLVFLSLAGLPLLHALRKREHLAPAH